MRFSFVILANLFLFFLATSAFAQQPNPFGAQAPLAAGAKKKSTSLKLEKAVRVIYGSSAWNKDPKTIDSASVVLREGQTDKILQVYLEETEPDSAVFSGLYQVSWENVEKFNPEFYVAPTNLLGKNAEIRELKKLIAEGKISRKPFIYRKSGKQQVIELYDTAEQARKAYQAYAAERTALDQTNKKVVSQSTADAANLAEAVNRNQATAKAALERVRMEQIETQRKAERLKEMERISRAETEKRKAEAKQLASEGLDSYKAADFKTAQDKFSKALALDPANTTFSFQYGVALYRMEQPNQAIVFLNMTEETQQNAAERAYYLGLAYYKLEDFPSALANFTVAAQSNHPDLSPSAEFYRGLILVEQKKFDDAMAAFQRVLDTSHDPKLDEKAEQMIERIQQLREYEKEKAKRWSANALIGEMYDSNVLLINDTSTTGSATDLIGYRTVLAAGVKFRPVYDQHREFAVTADALHLYTVDNKFKQRSDLRAADPTLLTLTLPYTIKSVAFNHGNKLDIKPGYEGLMSSQEDNAQKIILHSGFLGFDDTMVMNDNLLGTAKLEVRYDASQLRSSVGSLDASAVKTKFVIGGLRFVSADRAKMVIGDLGYTLNAAKGDEMKYNRYDLDIGFITPGPMDVTYNAKLNYYNLVYPKQSAKRTDNDVTLTLAGSKKINSIWTAGLMATYSFNSSNSTSYDYSKYTLLANMAANWDF